LLRCNNAYVSTNARADPTLFFSKRESDDALLPKIINIGLDLFKHNHRVRNFLRHSVLSCHFVQEDPSGEEEHFLKVHCPWSVLEKGATLLKLRKEIPRIEVTIYSKASQLYKKA